MRRTFDHIVAQRLWNDVIERAKRRFNARNCGTNARATRARHEMARARRGRAGHMGACRKFVATPPAAAENS
eukprot:3503259-Lingulodinium_polyedra.AAC.1